MSQPYFGVKFRRTFGETHRTADIEVDDADTANDQSASQSGGVDMAAMLAKNYAKKGYSAWAIMNNMSQNGYSDNEIARALEKAGVKG